MSPVEQAVGPHAFFWLQLAGYLVFAAGWIVVTLAIMRLLLDLVESIAKTDEPRRSSSPRKAMWPVASPVTTRKDLARVLAFPARKTRNRLVVR